MRPTTLVRPWLAVVSIAACAADPVPAGDGDGSTDASTTGEGTTGPATTATTATTVASEATGVDSESSGAEASSTGAEGCTIHVELEGSDGDGCGTASSPCGSLTHAITLAEAGCTIRIGAGTFSPATGEVPPWVPAADVDIVGAGAELTVLDDGEGSSAEIFAITCDVDRGATMVGASIVLTGGTLAALAVHGPPTPEYDSVLVLGGQVELSEIAVVGGGEGIYITNDAVVSITDADVSGAGHAGIKPAGDAVVTVERTRMHGNKDALEPICRATTTVRESEAFCNGNGLEALDRAQTTLIDNDVHHNINGMAARGVETSLVIRQNRVHDNSFGVVAIFATLDAGSAADLGANEIGPNRFAGLMLSNVPNDTMAIGNIWMPLVDGADADGAYAAGTIALGPVCSPYAAEIEAPPPNPCDPLAPVIPMDDVQNYVVRDGSCDEPPSCGDGMAPCPAIGALVLAVP